MLALSLTRLASAWRSAMASSDAILAVSSACRAAASFSACSARVLAVALAMSRCWVSSASFEERSIYSLR
jgi:hypothetical protein